MKIQNRIVSALADWQIGWPTWVKQLPFRHLGLLLSLALFTACVTGEQPANITAEHAEITNSAGESHLFRVEIADTNKKRKKGLSMRHQLAADAGMLFLFDAPGEFSFWMRNTFIPLDIIFIDSQGRIHKIHHNAVPMQDDRITSDGMVNSVLEINGGLSKKLGISKGDLVRLK